MKRTSLILVLITTALLSSAQKDTVKVDSLRAVMQSNRPYEQQIDAAIRLVETYQANNFDSALLEGNKAINLARKHVDSVAVAELKHRIGLAGYFKGNYDLAARNLVESASILEKSRNLKKLAPVYNDLGKLYRKTRDLDRSLENFDKAHAIYSGLKDTSGITMVLNESGEVYEYKDDYREAIKRYTSSMILAEKAGDSLSVSYSLSNIAGVYVIQGQYDEAEATLLRSLHIRENLKDSFHIALAFSDLGAAMSEKGDFKKAIDYFSKSNRIAEKLHYSELQSNNYNELSVAAQRQGDFQKAFEYFSKRTALRDSLISIEKSRELQRLNSQYQSAQREKQIITQQNRIRLQNILFIGLGLFLVLALLLAYALYNRYRIKKESQLQAEIMKQQEIKMKAVMEAEENERQRIAKDLHDGIGQMMSAAKMNLSAFESSIQFINDEQKENFGKIINLVDESCREIRTVSHIMMPSALIKNNLATAIRDFVNKLGVKSVSIHVYTEGLDQKLDSNVETVLYRVVQECVHNALKHAGATTLDISLIKDKDGISGTIEDNGKGFDASEKGESDGIGLKNIITRIEYLKGSVDFDTSPGRGTVVAFNVPLK
jgi:two-component system, NarL family, sensor kinase